MATIRDVATKAGVNPSTVSRVFSGKAKISKATQQRVLAAAAALDFHPNAIARSLSVRRTHTAAIVVPHIFPGYFEDCFFPQIMQGLIDVAYQRDFRILVSGSNSHEDNITQTFQILGSRQADGIVVLSNRLDVDTVGALRQQPTPFVLIGRPPSHYQDINWVDADNERHSKEAVEYLLTLGHRRIAFVGGDPDVAVTAERLRGYRAALAAANIPLCQSWVDFGYFAEDGGFQAVQRMMQLGREQPTAYYAANDLMAIGVMRALRERGICVPGEISVIGTNNSPESAHVHPGLTTVQVPYAEMAATALKILLEHIENPCAEPMQQYVDCKLLVRGSTGPAPLE